MVSHHSLAQLPGCTLPSWTVKKLEIRIKIMLMFIFLSTGWDWKEGWKRKEKRAWTQLPASRQPSQSHACAAQSSHYDRELPISAFQTSKCHLVHVPDRAFPVLGLCIRTQMFCVCLRTSLTVSASPFRGVQRHSCHIGCLLSLQRITCRWGRARAAANLSTMLMLLYFPFFFYMTSNSLQCENPTGIAFVLKASLRA